MSHRATVLTALILGLTFCAGCGTQVGIVAVPAEIYIEVGQTAAVNVMGVMDRGSNTEVAGPFTLTSNDEAVVAVSGQVVGGVAEGTAIITITDGVFTTTAVVHVVAAGTLPVQLVITPASIACTPASDHTQLEVFAVLTTGEGLDVTELAAYTSSDNDIALVTAEREVICVDGGEATITAEYLGVSDTIEVSVGFTPPSAVQFAPTSLTCEVGAVHQVQVLASMEDGSVLDATYAATYISSDNSVAFAYQGQVQCLGEGDATIIADVAGVSDSMEVEVEPAAADPDALVALNITPSFLDCNSGDVVAFAVVAEYGDGRAYDVTSNAETQYQISDGNVAMLLQGQVLGIQAGQATIQATFGGLAATATINVR